MKVPRIHIQDRSISIKNKPKAIDSVATILLSGQREAIGRAVIIDQAKASISLFYAPEALTYDFSRHMLTEPVKPGFSYQPAPGLPLKQIVEQEKGEVIFACCGQTYNLWANNSVVVIDGKIIKRQAPGILSKTLPPLSGTFPFFVFDKNRPGLTDLTFQDNNLQGDFSFTNGVHGPVLIKDWRDLHREIPQKRPNNGPSELTWDPLTRQAAMSAVGRTSRNQIIFLALAGNPKNGNEIKLEDLVRTLIQFNTTDAILLGASGDVQQYVRLSDKEEDWIIAEARPGSSMGNMFPDGRPLSNAIIVKPE